MNLRSKKTMAGGLAILMLSGAVFGANEDWSVGADAKPLMKRSMVKVYPNLFCPNGKQKSQDEKEYDYHALATAASNGDDESLSTILKGCADPNWKPSYVSAPPFFHANSPEVMLAFLNAGANIAILDAEDRSVLFRQAARTANDPERFSSFKETWLSKDPALLARHQKKGAALAQWNVVPKVWQPTKEQIEKLGKLLVINAEPAFFVHRDRYGYTALDAASYGGSYEILSDMLVKLGSTAAAELNAPKPLTTPTLDRALSGSCHIRGEEAAESRQEVAKLLLAAGANPMMKKPLRNSPDVHLSFADKVFWIRPTDKDTLTSLSKVMRPHDMETASNVGGSLRRGSHGVVDPFKLLKSDPLSLSCSY